jgi:hypothetical protein
MSCYEFSHDLEGPFRADDIGRDRIRFMVIVTEVFNLKVENPSVKTHSLGFSHLVFVLEQDQFFVLHFNTHINNLNADSLK